MFATIGKQVINNVIVHEKARVWLSGHQVIGLEIIIFSHEAEVLINLIFNIITLQHRQVHIKIVLTSTQE